MKYHILLLMFGIAGTLTAQESLLIDKVIAKVGTETILLSDIESQYNYLEQQQGIVEPEVRCEILQSIIGQKLIVHHAKLDSVVISEEEIEASLDFRIDQVLRQMGGDEELFKEYYGMTVAKMRGNLREDLEQQMLAERMQGALLNEVNITPKEVKAFFHSIPVDSIPLLSAEVELSEIVVKPKINEKERTKALKKILEIRSRILEEEADFASEATVYSDDPGSAAQGGNLGFAERGTFVPEFEATAYGLKPGELSEPVETEFGFHIIQMVERRGNKINLRHILVKPEITSADNDLAMALLDTVRARINRGELSFEQGVKLYSDEKIPSFSNNGMLQNPQTGNTFFEASQLPYEVYFAIEDSEVGDITEPLEYVAPTGETYYRILKLRERTDPHKASLQQDYAKIQRFAKEGKKNEYFANWIEEKFKTTFISLEKGYLECPDLDNLISSSN